MHGSFVHNSLYSDILHLEVILSHIFDSDAICANSFIDSGIWHFRVYDPSLICAYSSPMCHASVTRTPVCHTSVTLIPICHDSVTHRHVCHTSVARTPVCHTSVTLGPICHAAVTRRPVCHTSLLTYSYLVTSFSSRLCTYLLSPPCIIHRRGAMQ